LIHGEKEDINIACMSNARVYVINKVRQVSSTIKGERNSDEHYGRLAGDGPPPKKTKITRKVKISYKGYPCIPNSSPLGER
jgi:hypothetical protein